MPRTFAALMNETRGNAQEEYTRKARSFLWPCLGLFHGNLLNPLNDVPNVYNNAKRISPGGEANANASELHFGNSDLQFLPTQLNTSNVQFAVLSWL